MGIFNITYNDRIVELLPPDKRYPKTVAFFRAVVKQLQYLHKDIFIDFKTGSIYSKWVTGTYNKGDKVIYGSSVYESLIGSNTFAPNVETAWRLYQINFVGIDEQLKYNFQKLVFEYAINKRFGGTYRQPPLFSDIFLQVNSIIFSPFRVSSIENKSSYVGVEEGTEFIGTNSNFLTNYNLEINVIDTVYDAIDPTNQNTVNIIKGFANKYIPAGLTYIINKYSIG